MKKLLVVLFCCLGMAGCATSSHVTPDQVQFYTSLPQDSQKLTVLAVKKANWTIQEEDVVKLKQEAAVIGANGVLLASTGTESSDTKIQAIAIYVPKE